MFDYPEVVADTTPKGRFYHTPFGPTPSVTTILSSRPEPWLQEWIDRVGVEEAARVRDEACAIGTHMHGYLERLVGGLPVDRPEDDHQRTALKMARGLKMFALQSRNLTEVWGLEKALWFDRLYAGRADLIGCWQGVPSIIDYKTSLRRKSEDSIEGYLMQSCAYSMAHNEMFGTDIRQIVILIARRPDFRGEIEYQRFVVSGDDFTRHARSWTDRVDDYYVNGGQAARAA